jgi:branched-chain amino acid transport system substrate-binding protein
MIPLPFSGEGSFYPLFKTCKNIFLYMLRVGFLLPRSTLFPALNVDILQGLNTRLRLLGINDDIKLITENIGFGVKEQEIYSAAEKLLLDGDADMVIACIDTRITELLQPLFAASNKILIALNFGANLPDTWQPASTTLVHSLNFAFYSWLTGTMAPRETNGQLINTISYYDGGYTQCYCMLQASQVNGGVPRYNHITHFKKDEFTLAPLQAYLQENKDVHTLLCLFCGDMATIFYQHIQPLQTQYKLQLYGSPMMFDESLCDTLPAEVTDVHIKGYAPWLSSLENEQNQVFTNAIQQKAAKKANLFHLLGWDAATLLQAIKLKMDAGENNAAAIVQSLGDNNFESPRGRLYFDTRTHHTYGPAWLITGSNRLALTATDLNDTEENWQSFTTVSLPPGEASSWRNTYLCI